MQAAPPPKPVFNLSPDAQAMADTFNAVVDICKQGSNHAQEHKLHTVDEGLNSLFGACSVGSLGILDLGLSLTIASSSSQLCTALHTPGGVVCSVPMPI